MRPNRKAVASASAGDKPPPYSARARLISRRELLRSAGPAGALVWAAVGPLRAHAGRGAARKRFITFFSSSGVRQNIFWPKGDPGTHGTGRYRVEGTSLAGLAPYLGDVIIPKGIRIDRGPGDSHEAGTVASLTGNHLRALTLARRPVARGESLDHFLAKTMCRDTPEGLLVLGARLEVQRISKYTSYDEKGYEIQPLQEPASIYDRIVKRFLSSCGGVSRAAERDATLARLEKKSVLDTVLAETDTVKRAHGLDREEREKLERMEDVIRSVERRLDGVDVKASRAACGRSRKLEARLAVDNKDENYPELLALELDLIALALELDITRVITLSLSLGGSGGAPMRWLSWRDREGRLQPIEASHHNVTHGMQRNVANRDEKLEVIDRWNFEQFASLIGRLKAIREGASTVLDSALLWYATDVGEGGAHTAVDMPYLVAGRAGGSVRTGRYLALAEPVNHQRLLTDFCHHLGVDIPAWGRPGAADGASIL